MICNSFEKRLMFWSITHSWVGFFNNGDHWSVTHSTVGSHWSITLYSWVSTGVLHTVQWPPVRLVQSPKSFHCVLRIVTCLGSRGLNGVTEGAPSCWRGHGKCERRSPSVPLKDFTFTILHFTLHYLHYDAGQKRVFYHLDVVSVNALRRHSLLQVGSALYVAVKLRSKVIKNTIRTNNSEETEL